MSQNHEIVIYSRQTYCPYVALARDLLTRHDLSYRELLIDSDPVLADRVRDWTGHLSVPTLVIAPAGQTLPTDEIAPLPAGRSPKGVDRGPLITEPNNRQLEDWLNRHGFLGKPYWR